MVLAKKKYKSWKLVTVEWPQYFTYCQHCSGVWIDMRDTCNCGGLQRKTIVNHRILRFSGVKEPIAKFLVRFQGGRIL